jgi:hypothetical protein
MTNNDTAFELLPFVAGATVSATILVAEHYGLKSFNLKRTDAYVAGTLALDAGYLTYWALSKNKLGWRNIVPVFLMQAVGGLAVKGMYKLDGGEPAAT